MLNIDDFIEIDEEFFRNLTFDDADEISNHKKILEEMDQYALGGIKYVLLFNEPLDMVIVQPVSRTLH